MNERFSFVNLFPDFHSSEIDIDELERLVTEIVEKEHPNESVEDISYNDDGLAVELSSGTIIEIEIDWNEIIIS
jgi:hypothetical protein